ncbi:hypothetical protein BUALT_Bualt16G0027200 [Buddleja alternifolia]|uniref:Fe2OG dioxygenase domain-containing protein n=1 Tax=Buddleja alternifolia TaxID=168488 RepID=A0AAV6W8H4_9LAMI|nr:hypothetical protein BUALT_Bualt16G0027200 [Buddleja alternifolia]
MAEDAGRNSVPVIDMQDFPGQLRRLIEACEDWGCFRIVNFGGIVTQSVMVEMKEVVRSLFELPAEVKMRNVEVIAGSGYMAPSEINPLYEALGLYDMASVRAVDGFCSNLDATPHQSFTPETVGLPGVQLHTDSSFLTVLQDDEVIGGLEVMKRCGKFEAVDPCPGSLLVNLGDIATVWSNGRFLNVKHRVMCKEAGTRLSIASFLLGPKEAPVEVPLRLVDQEHPRLYVPFVYQDYRKLRISNKLHIAEALDRLRVQY